MEEGLIYIILFISVFLIITGFIQRLTAKWSFIPYTVALLVAGILGQFAVKFIDIPVHFELTSDIIYFVLLPLLLFESAFHINFHQFKLQFKTITFFATFGLLVSVFVIGYVLALAVGYPLPIAILFGAIISATDPIAVISMFKTLGAPKRLSLVADGESMLNDATGVIAFKVVSAFVLAGSALQSSTLLQSTWSFIYVFVGSLIFGAIVGYFFSKLIEKIDNDRVIETTMTVAAALGSFVAAEHFFHFSGVISCVMTGIVVGNLGKTKFSPGVREFVEEFWSYFAFLSVSLVFFFATFNLDFSIFTKNPLSIIWAIVAVLIGRAVSIYGSALVTNFTPFFKDEPNIPLNWQHILNWGGLRGVIPLVLAYSLPEDFKYRSDILAFTMGALLFTLLFNGLTIRTLLLKLGVHLPKKEEELLNEELTIMHLEEAKETINHLQDKEFDPEVIKELQQKVENVEDAHLTHLKEISSPEYFETSLRLQSLEIEREALEDLLNKGYISQNVFFDFDAELDLQQDALEYPEVFSGRAVEKGGKIATASSYRKRILGLRRLTSQFPLLKPFVKAEKTNLIKERMGLLRARILTSEMVLSYLSKIEKYLKLNKEQMNFIQKLVKEHKSLIEQNEEELFKMNKENMQIARSYQKKIAFNLLHSVEIRA